MIPAHFRPLWHAFLDFQRGETDAMVALWRDDGLAETLPVEYFFRTPDRFSDLEQEALALCRGPVLDSAAFAGAHSLALQSQGKKVCGLSWGDTGVEILEARGLLDSRGCPLDGVNGRFETVLRLSPGIGIAGSFEELDGFLSASRRLTSPGGQLLLYSRDVTRGGSPLQYVYAMLNRMDGRYPGEIRLQIEYKTERGPLFRWIHVDTPTLAEHAERAGWHCELIGEDHHGNYLARLT